MRRSRSRIVALACAAAALGSVPSFASTGPGCTLAWNTNPNGPFVVGGSRTCNFGLHGLPIQYVVEARQANSGAASVHLWVSPQGSPEIVLDECTASGAGYATCGGEISALVASGRFPPYPGGTGIALQCNVEWTGNRLGGAGCYTRDPCPSYGDPACLETIAD